MALGNKLLSVDTIQKSRQALAEMENIVDSF
jgi:hypothetical protein